MRSVRNTGLRDRIIWRAPGRTGDAGKAGNPVYPGRVASEATASVVSEMGVLSCPPGGSANGFSVRLGQRRRRKTVKWAQGLKAKWTFFRAAQP